MTIIRSTMIAPPTSRRMAQPSFAERSGSAHGVAFVRASGFKNLHVAIDWKPMPGCFSGTTTAAECDPSERAITVEVSEIKDMFLIFWSCHAADLKRCSMVCLSVCHSGFCQSDSVFYVVCGRGGKAWHSLRKVCTAYHG